MIFFIGVSRILPKEYGKMKNVMVRHIDEQMPAWLKERALSEQRAVPGGINYLLDYVANCYRFVRTA